MTLLNGQSWRSSCPYFWDHCGRNDYLCDGCDADKDQRAGHTPAPWVKGTDPDYRHRVVRVVATKGGAGDMRQLLDSGIGWFDWDV